MKYRFMRLICAFDLPQVSATDKKNYRQFRKYLITQGFYMMQESLYCKLCLNMSVVNSVINKIKNDSPGSGVIQLLVITEKQYSKIEYVIGKSTTNVENSDERFLII